MGPIPNYVGAREQTHTLLSSTEPSYWSLRRKKFILYFDFHRIINAVMYPDQTAQEGDCSLKKKTFWLKRDSYKFLE